MANARVTPKFVVAFILAIHGEIGARAWKERKRRCDRLGYQGHSTALARGARSDRSANYTFKNKRRAKGREWRPPCAEASHRRCDGGINPLAPARLQAAYSVRRPSFAGIAEFAKWLSNFKAVETSQAGQIKQRMPAGSPTIEFEPLYRKCLVSNFAARQKAILVLLSLMSLTGVERRRIQAASEATLLLLQSTKLSQ